MAPQAVVLVESEEDIAATVRYAVQRGIPLTPRAAGTNLTGSAIGSGIILDVSRLNRVLELNREERWARVQPGIVLAELNKQLARHGSAVRSRSLQRRHVQARWDVGEQLIRSAHAAVRRRQR